MKAIITSLFLLFATVSVAQQVSLDSIKAMSPEEGLFYALEHYGVFEPHIVYAQAVLETGHFKSTLCVRYGNLFGIYDIRTKAYKHYPHWVESVVDYKESVQSKWKGGDYYYFLEQLPYATAPGYIKTLRIIAERYVQYD